MNEIDAALGEIAALRRIIDRPLEKRSGGDPFAALRRGLDRIEGALIGLGRTDARLAEADQILVAVECTTAAAQKTGWGRA